jgi:hypothetical protein
MLYINTERRLSGNAGEHKLLTKEILFVGSSKNRFVKELMFSFCDPEEDRTLLGKDSVQRGDEEGRDAPYNGMLSK